MLNKISSGFWLILAVYFILAGIYANVTPPFEKPDENWHFAAAMYIAENARLPQNTSPTPDHYARQQANQPPLYYLTLAPLLRGFNDLTPGFLILSKPNEQYTLSESPIQSDNRRLFIPGRCEDNCAQVRTAVMIGRFLSMSYVGLSLIFTALTVRLLFPAKPALLLLTVALIGLNPQVLHIGSSVSNDSLMILLMSVGFYLAARWLTSEQSRRFVILMGLVAGAAVLTKLSAAVLGLVLGLLLLIRSQRRIRDLVLYGSASIAVCGWWFVYNWVTYGDPTALDHHISIAPQPGSPETASEFLSQLPTVMRSFWAEFGWGQIILPDRFYNLIYLFLLGSLLVGCVAVLGRWRRFSDKQQVLWLMAGGVFIISVVLLLRWMTMTQAPHGRLLFPALLPISLTMAFGLSQWLPARWQMPWSTVIGAGLFLFAVLMPASIIPPFYATPQPLADPQPGTISDITFHESPGGSITVQDVVLIEEPDWFYVQLSWQIEQPFVSDYLVFVHLLNENGDIIAQRDSYPGLSNLPFTRMKRGTISNDIYPLAPPTQSVAAVRIGVYRFGDLPQTWIRLEAESDQFDVQDNAVTIPREAIRIE